MSRARSALVMLFFGPILACSSKEDAPRNSQVNTATGGSSATGGTGGSAASGGTGGGTTGGTSGGGSGGSAMGGSGGDGGSMSAGGTSGGGQSGGGSGGSGGSGIAGSPSHPVVDSLPCFQDEGTPAGDALKLALIPNRVTGVAPLSVFFDTVGTTSEETQKPFHDLSYCWDFGDPDSGNFATTGLTRNQARGPLAGHVFETPGTYSVTVSARDSMGRVSSQAVEITVDEPDQVFAGTATVCLSPSGDFEGCPDGAEQVTGGSLADLSSYLAPGKRFLLHRGESFDGKMQLNVAGPGHIGPYGSASAAPVIQSSGMVFTISSGENPAFDDWRIVDLDFVGADPNSEIAYVQGLAFNFLLLRPRGRDLGASVRAPDSAINYWNINGTPGHDVIDGLTIQDADIQDVSGTDTGGNLLGVTGHRVLLLGNLYANSTKGEHIWRMSLLDRAVISDNHLANAPEPRHLLKMHGSHFDEDGIGKGKYTERILISDNIFEGTGGHGWSLALGPENDQTDERLRDLIIERNLFLPGEGLQVALMLWGSNFSVRNNLFNRGAFGGCIGGGQRGLEPPSDSITILHNTCYSASERPNIASFAPQATNIRIFNNLSAGPMASGTGVTGAVAEEAGNLSIASPGFADAALMKWEDFALTKGSAAIDAADPAHSTAWDYSGVVRPVDGDASGSSEPDLGAMEYEP